MADTEIPKPARAKAKAKPAVETVEAPEASLDIKQITFKREDY
ncbi:hypothetical protein [Neorhizobium sp. S3-V5DH]|nr:hypothetical protein [Neorhizobium sp. S3-V5DH]